MNNGDIPMAYTISNDTASNIRHTLARPFVALSNLMDGVAEANSMAQAAKRIPEMSDDGLAAKGMTRAEAIHRVFLTRNQR